MNQTRTFLIFAWLMVAALLWMAWGQDQAALRQAAQAPTTQPAATAPAVPQAPAAGQVPHPVWRRSTNGSGRTPHSPSWVLHGM